MELAPILTAAGIAAIACLAVPRARMIRSRRRARRRGGFVV